MKYIIYLFHILCHFDFMILYDFISYLYLFYIHILFRVFSRSISRYFAVRGKFNS